MDVRHLINVVLTTLIACEAATIAIAIFVILLRRRVGHREMLKDLAFFNASFAAQSFIVAVDLGVRSFGWGLTSIRAITVITGFRCVLKIVQGLPNVEQTLEETETADMMRHERASKQDWANHLLLVQGEQTLSVGREHLRELTGQVDGAK